MLVESRGLPSDSTCILKPEPGKLDTKRRKQVILFISLQVSSLFKPAIIDLVIDFCVDSESLATSFKKRNVNMTVKTHAVRKTTFIRPTCNNTVKTSSLLSDRACSIYSVNV